MAARQSAPYGFNNDEASLGWGAYSILKFGIDRQGIAYSAGLTEGAVRAVSMLVAWRHGLSSICCFAARPEARPKCLRDARSIAVVSFDVVTE